MIGLHLSVQYSGYLSSVCVNGYMAVERKLQNKKQNKKNNNRKIQKSTLVNLSAISIDPVGLGDGGSFVLPSAG